VRKDQRRTLAAVRAGLDRVKVIVEVEVEAEPDASAAAQIERIVDQLGENQHRANIVDVDEVRAHQQGTEFRRWAAGRRPGPRQL
jgi:ParB family chromosome partitioning protein